MRLLSTRMYYRSTAVRKRQYPLQQTVQVPWPCRDKRSVVDVMEKHRYWGVSAHRQLLRLPCHEHHGIMWPRYEQAVSNWVLPVMFGELAIMLWLIIMGAKEQKSVPAAA
jgi:hypothetical protein